MLDRAIDEEQKVHNDFLILVRNRGPPCLPNDGTTLSYGDLFS